MKKIVLTLAMVASVTALGSAPYYNPSVSKLLGATIVGFTAAISHVLGQNYKDVLAGKGLSASMLCGIAAGGSSALYNFVYIKYGLKPVAFGGFAALTIAGLLAYKTMPSA